MGRNKKYTNETVVRLRPDGKTKLQIMSERRAIVNLLIEHAGVMTMGAIDEHFGYDIRESVIRLIRSGWLVTEDER